MNTEQKNLRQLGGGGGGAHLKLTPVKNTDQADVVFPGLPDFGGLEQVANLEIVIDGKRFRIIRPLGMCTGYRLRRVS